MKNDGHDHERFETALRQIVNVPKEELKRREELAKAKKAKTQ